MLSIFLALTMHYHTMTAHVDSQRAVGGVVQVQVTDTKGESWTVLATEKVHAKYIECLVDTKGTTSLQDDEIVDFEELQ